MKKFTLLFSLMMTVAVASFAQTAALEPTMVSPTPDNYTSKIGYVAFQFSKAVEVEYPQDSIRLYNSSNEVAARLDSYRVDVAPDGGSMVIFQFEPVDSIVQEKDGKTEVEYINKVVLKNGTYTLTMPAGVIKSTDGEVFAGGTYTFKVRKPKASYTVTPEDGATLLEIENINFNIINAADITIDETKTVMAYAINAGDEYEGTVTYSGNNGMYTVTVAFDEVLTEEDQYTIAVPAGLFTLEGTANEELRLTYTVKHGTPLAIESILPAEGEVSEISRITILFNQRVAPGMDENWQRYDVYLTNEKGEKLKLTYVDELDENYNPKTPVNGVIYGFGEYDKWGNTFFDKPLTTPGTYKLNLEEVVVQYNHDPSSWTFKEQGAVEGIVTWTIVEGGTGIEDVKGENEEEKTVYDLTGKRVENPSNGIYIINGKKSLVK